MRGLEYLRRGGKSDFLNLGTGHGFSVLEVVECARQVTGRTIDARIEPPRAGDPSRLIADSSKARAVLGWEPVVSDLRSFVRSAWEWRLRPSSRVLGGLMPAWRSVSSQNQIVASRTGTSMDAQLYDLKMAAALVRHARAHVLQVHAFDLTHYCGFFGGNSNRA